MREPPREVPDAVSWAVVLGWAIYFLVALKSRDWGGR